MLSPWPGDVEVLRPDLPRRRCRAVLFDFDGTLSLLREGWVEIMTDLALAALRPVAAEPEHELAALVEREILRRNGQPTVAQMRWLAEEVGRRGGRGDPAHYLDRYHERLHARIRGRHAELTGGAARPAEWAVPGAHALLDQLRARGLALALASGTEIDHVRREAELLGLAGYFGERIYAPADVLAPFAKGAVIAALVAEWGLGPGELLGFGDGVVETEEVRRAGGVAVGVASRPRGETGINPWKRRQLVAAGADLIIPDYRQAGPVVDGLCKG